MARERIPFSYRALQAWGRTAVHAFYAHTEVTGISNVSTGRPAVLAVNHGNALADIALLAAKMPRFPQFLAASSWWKSPPARVLFRLGGVVPIHRQRDGGTTDQNLSTFAACHAALAGGAHIAIFPEGEMHIEPALMPLKTGAARIALGAATEAGVRGVVIIPVGIVYEDRGRFRSDVEIRFGEPIEIDEWVDRARSHPGKAAREVTDILADRLAEVTVNHGSHAEAELLDRAAALALPDAAGASDRSYARRNELRRALASAVTLAGGETSTEYLGLASAVDAHLRDLAQLGLAGAHLIRPLAEPAAGERSHLDAELARLAVPAALGLVANAPVVAGAALASTRAKHESWKATAKGVAATFLSPIVWALEYVYLARRTGRARALALTAAGATGGLATLAWRERFLRRREITWLECTAADAPEALAAARASREAVRERVASLTGSGSRRGGTDHPKA